MVNPWRWIWGALGVLCFVFWLWVMVGDHSLLNAPVDQDNVPQKLQGMALFIGVLLFGAFYGLFGTTFWVPGRVQNLLAYPFGFLGATILFLLSGANVTHMQPFEWFRLGLLTLPLSTAAYGILYSFSPSYFRLHRSGQPVLQS